MNRALKKDAGSSCGQWPPLKKKISSFLQVGFQLSLARYKMDEDIINYRYSGLQSVSKIGMGR